ncbi:hypothetical protein D3C85_1460780 [compost metagenome]
MFKRSNGCFQLVIQLQRKGNPLLDGQILTFAGILHGTDDFAHPALLLKFRCDLGIQRHGQPVAGGRSKSRFSLLLNQKLFGSNLQLFAFR